MNWHNLLSHTRLGSEHKPEVPRNYLRSEFEVDFDRIIFSYPFRRLQDKTQVVPLPEHDFVHTRLTHSLEVSSVGRSLGRLVGESIIQKYPDLAEAGYSPFDFGAIVAAASLAHDIGNPPFGHSGEKAISNFYTNHPGRLSETEYADLVNFEGNAQGFRILCDDRYKDLKLTYATLGTFTKYPCPSHFNGRNKQLKSQKKYGYFATEAPVFKQIANQLGVTNTEIEGVYARHPLTFLVEAADDICYMVIDLEDAARMRTISFESYVNLLAPILGSRLQLDKLQQIEDDHQRVGVLRAMTINVLVDQCVQVFIEHESAILNGTFDQALSDLIPAAQAAQTIAEFSYKNIYQAPRVLEIQAAGFEVLPGLLANITEAVEDLALHGKKANAKHQNLIQLLQHHHFNVPKPEDSYYERARKIIDFVSGITDTFAVNFYRKIKGISL